MTEARHFSPSAERNCRPILDVLRQVLPNAGLVLEVASGSGQHAAFLAPHFPALEWQPSDPDAAARASIAAWTEANDNVRPPLDLDAARPDWPLVQADAVVCINMIHIAPWAAALGLLAGAARALPADGVLYLYGPYCREGQPTVPSNAAFDADLRARNPEWGLRDLGEMATAAAVAGFGQPVVIPMPANNLSVVFRRTR